MGQGGSISENKSMILSNWVQTKPNSNIFYNKVTNQQIERHEVLINDKQELSSYSARMHNQSLLICRLIYFHPKSTPKDEAAKKHHTKNSSNEIPTDENRSKSMLKQPSQLNIEQKSSPKNGSSNQLQMQPRVYCVYTDRMIPVKEWNKDKIIDTIEAFKKLTQVYGFFKVREHCICENERKEIKIWVNQNPVSNFVVQSVESEEDMIADLAALLVSKKEKIAKQLLDLEYFSQVIQHFSKLNDYEFKKYHTSNNNPNSTKTSNRTTGFPTASYRQSETSQPSSYSSEVNNFYNVFINTENSHTVNSSLQSSKYNIINKGSFGYPFYEPNAQKSNQESQNSKQSQNYDNATKEAGKTENIVSHKTASDIKVKRQYSPTQYGLLGTNLTLGAPPSLTPSPHQDEQQSVKNRNPSSYNSMNYVSQTTILTKESRKKATDSQQKLDFIQENRNSGQNLGEKDLMENTSILLNAKKGNSSAVKKYSLESQKKHESVGKEEKSHINYMTTSEKKTPSTIAPTSSLHSTQTTKSNLISKFIPSSHQDIKNRSKNNSNCDIALKSNLKTQNNFPIENFETIRRQVPFNVNRNEAIKTTTNQKEFFSNGSVEKAPSSFQNYLAPQNNMNEKPGSSFNERRIQINRNSGGSNLKQQPVGDVETKSFIKTQYNPYLRSQSKVFVKSQNYEQNELIPNFQSTRNVVSQMSTIKPPNSQNQTPTIPNTLSKKSFPKYFQEKQSGKSIQKYYKNSLEQREKSRAIIGNLEDESSGENFSMVFRGDVLKYENRKIKDVFQEVVQEVPGSENCSQQMIPSTNGPQPQRIVNQASSYNLKNPHENFQPRRKFPSTTEGKPKKLLDVKHLKEMQCKKSKQGTEVDSQQSNDPMKPKILTLTQPKNNEMENKSCIMTKSYFSHINTNNSVMVSKNQYNKQHQNKKGFDSETKNKKPFETTSKQDNQSDVKFKFKDLEKKEVEDRPEMYSHESSGSGPFYKMEEKESLNFEEPKSRDSIVEFEDPSMRNQSFPYKQNSSIRKNEKQFTFFNSNQKPTGVANIEEINPFEPIHNKNSKNKVYFKKQSIKSVDEQQTLPRTTADERQKRMFKETRTSEVLIETSELHSSDPGHKIEQLVEKIEKQKEALIKKNAQMMLQEKIDVKQYPIFKKWQPSMNVFGSLINHQQQTYSSCIKKKEYSKSQQQSAHDDKLSLQDQKKEEHDKIYPGMANSDNLQTKKKIRKEVFMDYKGLFGDENPFLKQETPEEKEKARRLQVKKRREEEERLLENASSKDLLIQEKVQKQKEKHAQLKSDLSKLFTQQM